MAVSLSSECRIVDSVSNFQAAVKRMSIEIDYRAYPLPVVIPLYQQKCWLCLRAETLLDKRLEIVQILKSKGMNSPIASGLLDDLCKYLYHLRFQLHEG